VDRRRRKQGRRVGHAWHGRSGARRARGHFPTDEAALKLLYLVLNRTEKEWTMPAREWSMAKAQFAVLFGGRFNKAIA
jgi:putative transposase